MAVLSKLNHEPIQISLMSERELARFSKLVYDECGIQLNGNKRSMLSARLAKRLRALGIGSYKEYYDYVTSIQGRKSELIPMIDVVTTNTTQFFRENRHFEILVDRILPSLGDRKPLQIWSAGCSSGEEPYTLAMVLADYYGLNDNSFDIIATDISTNVLFKAKQAIYSEESVEAVSKLRKIKYLMKGKGEQAGNYRIVPELRERVSLARLNFLHSFEVIPTMDIIFCRNALIYFDWKLKKEIINKFYDVLSPGGYLFVGHSETLNGLDNRFISIVPTIYMKPGRYD